MRPSSVVVCASSKVTHCFFPCNLIPAALAPHTYPTPCQGNTRGGVPTRRTPGMWSVHRQRSLHCNCRCDLSSATPAHLSTPAPPHTHPTHSPGKRARASTYPLHPSSAAGYASATSPTTRPPAPTSTLVTIMASASSAPVSASRAGAPLTAPSLCQRACLIGRVCRGGRWCWWCLQPC